MLGEGDGRALARLLVAAPKARIEVVEVRAEMIALAERRTRKLVDRITFYCEDARAASWPAAHYDAGGDELLLDCFTEKEAVLIWCGGWRQL